MVINLFVLPFRLERDVLEHCTKIWNFEIGAGTTSRTERTCARTQFQNRCDVFGFNLLFLAYLIAVHVK